MFSCCGAKSVTDKNLDMSGKNMPEQKKSKAKQSATAIKKLESAPASKDV